MKYRSAYPLLWTALFWVALFWSSPAGIAWSAADGPPPETEPQLRLVIDYGDGVQKHFLGFIWRDGITVLDVLRAADAHPRGIDFEYRGRGATAFLTRIDELKNEGAGKNWIFRVNGQLADRSFGVFQLKRGDTVLWRFGDYR